MSDVMPAHARNVWLSEKTRGSKTGRTGKWNLELELGLGHEALVKREVAICSDTHSRIDIDGIPSLVELNLHVQTSLLRLVVSLR
jgi:hypothetical protein